MALQSHLLAMQSERELVYHETQSLTLITYCFVHYWYKLVSFTDIEIAWA